MRVINYLTISIIFSIVLQLSIEARPQYSLLQTYGAKCQSCHVNVHGGGARNFPGWLSRKDITAINPASIGIDGFYNFISESNTYFNDLLLFSMDTRFQTARWGRPDASRRDYMVMQVSPYFVVQPFDWMHIDLYYNFAYHIEPNKRYPGMEYYNASVYFTPFKDLPSIRAGYFQPPIGTKWDDHTLLVKRVSDQGKSQLLMPHDYSEWGIQIDYENIDWLGASFGVFGSENLSKNKVRDYIGNVKSMVNPNSLSYVFRLGVYPTLPGGYTSYMGGTLLLNGGLGFGSDGFYMKNDYLYVASLNFNIGISDKIALLTEYVTSEKQHSFTTDNFLIELNYQIFDYLILFARAERATTRQRIIDKDFYTNVNQYVLGAHINILPYIDLLPEYRIYDRELAPSYQSQWAFQIHLFY